MEGWTTFFIIVLSIAFIVTIALILRSRNSDDDTPSSSSGTVRFPASYTPAVQETKQTADETAPADVTVIYEDLASRALKCCANCGCENDPKEAVCEACGSLL